MNKFLFILIVFVFLFNCTSGKAFIFSSNKKYDTIELYDKAHDQYKDGKYKEAIVEYQKFLDKYPANTLAVAAYYYMAKSYEETGNYAKARSCYQQVIEKYKKGFWVDSAKDDIRKIKSKNNNLIYTSSKGGSL